MNIMCERNVLLTLNISLIGFFVYDYIKNWNEKIDIPDNKYVKDIPDNKDVIDIPDWFFNITNEDVIEDKQETDIRYNILSSENINFERWHGSHNKSVKKDILKCHKGEYNWHNEYRYLKKIRHKYLFTRNLICMCNNEYCYLRDSSDMLIIDYPIYKIYRACQLLAFSQCISGINNDILDNIITNISNKHIYRYGDIRRGVEQGFII